MYYPAIEYRNRVHLALGGLFGLGWLRTIEADDTDPRTPIRTIDVPQELNYPPLPYDEYVAKGVLEALNTIAHRIPTHPLLGDNSGSPIRELTSNPHRVLPDHIDFYTQHGELARPMDRAARLSLTDPTTREETRPLIDQTEIASPRPTDFRTAVDLHA